MTQRKRGTRTSSFGSPGRESHDSSRFYSGRLYSGLPKESRKSGHVREIDPEKVDRIFVSSSERMEELPDNSVHLMITSPPYNVGKDYDSDATLEEYLDFLGRVWKETYRVLVPGGRACINIANLGRKPYIPLNSFVTRDMIGTGFLMRGEIIWNKGSSASTSTAWGTWLSPKNPVLRDVHEYILVFSKDSFSRDKGDGESTVTKPEFLESTKSVWSFPSESATSIGHPAPFPVELPRRLIQLYSFKGDIILDPFMGSGQTAIAAIRTGRKYVGYETSREYTELARKRIGVELSTGRSDQEE